MDKIDWEKEKNNLQELIEKRLPFNRIAKLYNIKKGETIKKIAIKLGIKIINPKTGEYYTISNEPFKCKYCGKEFTDKRKLAGHTTFCKNNPNIEHNLKVLQENRSKIKNQENFAKLMEKCIDYCQFCGKECHSKQSLYSHERTCKENPDRIKNFNKQGLTAWNKGKTMLDDARIAQYTTTRKNRIKSGEIIIKGKQHTEETKEKLRKKMIEYIKTTGNGQFGEHYSIKGCDYIDKLNELHGWNLQHALNGGEKEVCGYFLDGYDEKLNIAFEYDEPKHYKDVLNNILKERDIKRQNLIIDKLHCEFYRYNEKTKLFYKVN